MSDKSSIKWHEVINATEQQDGLEFFELYREYARALHEKNEAKKRQGYWPFPTE